MLPRLTSNTTFFCLSLLVPRTPNFNSYVCREDLSSSSLQGVVGGERGMQPRQGPGGTPGEEQEAWNQTGLQSVNSKQHAASSPPPSTGDSHFQLFWYFLPYF